MKILVLNPFAGEMKETERCQRVAASDTDIVFDHIGDVYPLNYVTYIYYRHRCADAVVDRVLRAQNRDFDAVFICCCYDPGVWEARELADIPVVGAFEAAAHYANAISQRYSVIATEYKTAHCYRELARLYGTDSKLASVRHIGLSARESYPDRTDPNVIVDRTLKVAAQCVAEDGAEAIVMGCTLQSCPLTVSGTGDAAGAPIIDPVLVGLKTTEFLVEARRVGLPTVSRFGTWQKPPWDEVEQLRAASAQTRRNP
ncbi:MAG: aspartate/glutamate racemase family protein [Acidobacteriota bacterium]